MFTNKNKYAMVKITAVKIIGLNVRKNGHREENKMEIGDIKYTVEITDAAKYKELIDNGYSLERLYDTKEIYEIIGPPFN